MFAFRVSRSFNEVGDLLKQLYEWSESVVIYEHEADEDVSRTHIHGLIIGCQRKEDTLRDKIFKINWKKDYQLATTYKDNQDKVHPVNEGYVTYMAKGHLSPMLIQNFSEEKINDLKSKWIVYDTAKKSCDVKAKKDLSVYDHCEAIRNNMSDILGDFHLNILENIRRYKNKHRIKTNAYADRDWYDTILSQGHPEVYRTVVWNLIKKRDGHF